MLSVVSSHLLAPLAAPRGPFLSCCLGPLLEKSAGKRAFTRLNAPTIPLPDLECISMLSSGGVSRPDAFSS